MPNQLGGGISVNQLRTPIDFQNGCRGYGQVDNENANRHVNEQLMIALLAGQTGAIDLVGYHAELAPFT
jgi:hypothetical protein